MTLLFNNCAGRPHASIYHDADAFFDVEPTGSQSAKCTGLKPGDICIVASYAPGGVALTPWKYTHQKILPDDQGERLRVFFGKPIEPKVMPKAAAAIHKDYRGLFNKRGHFKRISVFVRDH